MLTERSISHLYAEVSVLLQYDLATALRGWFNPFQRICPPRARTSLHTRMTWMRLAMIYLGNLGLACNFESYRYSPTTFSHAAPFLLYIYCSFFTLASDTPPHEVNHHYICFIPHIQLSLHISIFFLSNPRSTIHCESRLY